MKQFNILSCGIAVGLVWAIACLITGWTATAGWGNDFVDVMNSIYIGYNASFFGGIIGGIWAFVDAGIGGVLFAFFYNHLSATKKAKK